MKLIKLSIILCLCVSLAACVPFAAELRPTTDAYEMPVPEPIEREPAIGDTVAERLCEAVLYYPAVTQQILIPVTKTVTVPAGQTLEESLIRTLLEEPLPVDVRRPVPDGTTLLNLHRSGSTAVVDLSIDARNVDSPQELLLTRVAIAETLCAVDGIDAVDVLIGGRSECPTSLPQGALSHEDISFISRWAQAIADTELNSGELMSDRQVVLYSLSRDGRFLIPHAETLSFDSQESCVSVLIDALSQPSDDSATFAAPLPDFDGSLIVSSELVDLPDGKHVARLTFDGSLTSLLERSSLSAWSMYAALTCTLTGFLPALDGLQIYIGDGQLVQALSPAGEVVFENGILTRSSFEAMIGQAETIYLTAEDGSLRSVARALNVKDSISPRMLLAELFRAPGEWESGVFSVVPEELTIDELLGLRIENGEAVLNFSASFYAACQRLTPPQERNLIYAIVNTLTNRPDVNTVIFQIEGGAVDMFVSSISLVSPLTRNPGLIS